jgi:hypothetical protein
MNDSNYVASCTPMSPPVWDLEYFVRSIFVAQSVPLGFKGLITVTLLGIYLTTFSSPPLFNLSNGAQECSLTNSPPVSALQRKEWLLSMFPTERSVDRNMPELLFQLFKLCRTSCDILYGMQPLSRGNPTTRLSNHQPLVCIKISARQKTAPC